MSSARLAVRLAWRAARRERLATLLTALLVALPVVALVAAGVLATSTVIPDSVASMREFGASDAIASLTPAGNGLAVTAAPPDALLPAGSRVLADTYLGGETVLASGGTGARGTVAVHEFNYADPLASGVVIPESGHAPRSLDEVTVTSYLATRFHLHEGDTLRFAGLGDKRIVGTVVDPKDIRARVVYALAGAFPSAGTKLIDYLIKLPAGSDKTLNLPEKYSLAYAHSEHTTFAVDDNQINSGALVILLALLEASLTAGTAFAVGARRRRRDLALIAVNGGRGAHTGGVVLANGLVCGVVGVVVGLAGGLTAARIGFPHLRDHTSTYLPGLRVKPLLLVAAAAFGLVSALVSAGFPAVLAARGSLRHALGKARGSSGTPGWITVAGTGVFGLGVAVMTAAVHDASRGNGQQTTTALLGVVFVELGGVAVCPALLGVAGRLGSRLPALPRLALRDAARQRARSGPAVAAIAAAVSGAMALSVYLASDHLGQVRAYQPPLPRDLVTVQADSNMGIDSQLVATLLGPASAARAASTYELTDNLGQSLFAEPAANSPSDSAAFGGGGDVVVGDTDLLRLLGATAAAVAALDQGSAVTDSDVAGTTALRFELTGSGNARVTTSSVPRVAAGWRPGQGRPDIIVSPATAARLLTSLGVAGRPPTGAAPRPALTIWAPIDPHRSDTDRRTLQQRAFDLGGFAQLDAGVGDDKAPQSLALLGVAALFSLIVTAVATVLAAAESQGDLAILGAVGASGIARRLFTAAQGSITALLGGVLGIAIGLVPGIAVVRASVIHLPLDVPWQPFAAFLIGLPLLAGLGGLLFSRSKLPAVTRTL